MRVSDLRGLAGDLFDALCACEGGPLAPPLRPLLAEVVRLEHAVAALARASPKEAARLTDRLEAQRLLDGLAAVGRTTCTRPVGLRRVELLAYRLAEACVALREARAGEPA